AATCRTWERAWRIRAPAPAGASRRSSAASWSRSSPPGWTRAGPPPARRPRSDLLAVELLEERLQLHAHRLGHPPEAQAHPERALPRAHAGGHPPLELERPFPSGAGDLQRDLLVELHRAVEVEPHPALADVLEDGAQLGLRARPHLDQVVHARVDPPHA